MKLIAILAVLFVSGTSFAGTTSHHWFAKVPVNQGSEHMKRTKYTKGFKGVKAFKNKSDKKSAVLTRTIEK